MLNMLKKFHILVKLFTFLQATSPIKLKLGQQIGEGLLIANHLVESLWSTNQKYCAAVGSYLLHSFFCRCTVLLATAICAIMPIQNPSSWTKPANFDFSSSNFTLQDHILSIAALQMLFITSKCLTMSDEKPYSFAESSQTFTPKNFKP